MSHGRMVHLAANDGDAQVLGSVERVQVFVDNLCGALGMSKIDSLMVDIATSVEKLGREPFEDEGGITGCLILSTSHITIHTWPLRRHTQLSVYSCRDFDPAIVSRLFCAFFSADSTLVKLTDCTFALG